MVTGLTCYDCVIGDRSLPEFAPLEKTMRFEAERSLRPDEIPINEDPYVRWQELKVTLAILDDINPVVSSWVRYHHANRTLVFVNSEGAAIDPEQQGNIHREAVIAKYDYISRKLYISTLLYHEKHGKRASLLCHEYRHSQQNFAKYFRYILSHAFIGGGRPEIIENDAFLYEREAEAAIYGEQGSPHEVNYGAPTSNPRP